MEKVQCANCNSYKVKVYSRQYKFTLGILLVSVGFMMAQGMNTDQPYLMILAAVGYGVILTGILYIILGITHKSAKAVCKSCANEWRISG